MDNDVVLSETEKSKISKGKEKELQPLSSQSANSPESISTRPEKKVATEKPN